MRTILALVFTAAVTLAGCTAGPSVRVDRDPYTRPSQFRSFAFYDPAPADAARYSTLTAQRLRTVTRVHLESLGYQYDERAPEMRVNFIVAMRERQDVRSTATTPRGIPVYRGWGGHVDLETVHYKVGTLAIDLVDANRNVLVWRGVAEGRLDDRTLREPGDAVGKAVKAIFAKLPTSGAPVG